MLIERKSLIFVWKIPIKEIFDSFWTTPIHESFKEKKLFTYKYRENCLFKYPLNNPWQLQQVTLKGM